MPCVCRRTSAKVPISTPFSAIARSPLAGSVVSSAAGYTLGSSDDPPAASSVGSAFDSAVGSAVDSLAAVSAALSVCCSSALSWLRRQLRCWLHTWLLGRPPCCLRRCLRCPLRRLSFRLGRRFRCRLPGSRLRRLVCLLLLSWIRLCLRLPTRLCWRLRCRCGH